MIETRTMKPLKLDILIEWNNLFILRDWVENKVSQIKKGQLKYRVK